MSTWLPFIVAHVRDHFGDKSPVQDELGYSCSPSETQADLAGNTSRGSFDEQQEAFPAATPTRRGHSNPINDQTWQNWAKHKTGRSYRAPEIPKEPHGSAYQNQEPYELPSPNGSISEEGGTLVPSASEYDFDAEEADVIQVKHLDQDDMIKKMIEALGKKCDDQPGYVYTFYDPESEPSNPSVKVGHTLNPKVREDQHKTNCKRENWELKYGDSFRGYKCVERLVLIELHNRRSSDVCNCGTRHREYFDVDIAHASGLIKSWQIWLRTYEPYTRGGILKTVWQDRLDLFQSQSSKFFLCETCKVNRTSTSDPKAKGCCIRAGWEAWTNPARARYRYQAFLALIKDTRTSHSLTRPARFLLMIIWARLLISAIFYGGLPIPTSSDAISVVHAAFLSLGVVFDLVIPAILFLWVSFAPNREIARIEDTEASESPRKESKAGANSVKESCTTPTKCTRKKAAEKTPPSTPKRIDTKTPKSSPAPQEDMELRARPRHEPSATPIKSPKTKGVGKRSRKVLDSPPTTGNEKPATNVSSNMTPPHHSGTTWPIDTSTPPALGKILERSFDSNQAR